MIDSVAQLFKTITNENRGKSNIAVAQLMSYMYVGREIMNNSWNLMIYKIWSPIYDKIFNSGVFLHARRQIFQDIVFHTNQRILFVGIGTGADLELVTQSDLDITAIDFSPDMLKKARAKFKNSPIKFLEMDAQNMVFKN